MNKLSYLFLTAAAGLAMTSCSQDDIANNGVTGDTATLNLSVKLPGDVATRALGDGEAATTLKIYVFELVTADGVTTPTLLFPSEATINPNGNTVVNLDLVTGKSYQLALFATSPLALGEDAAQTPAVYTISDEGELSVSYSNMTSEGNMADAYDCFYGNYKIEKLSSSISEEISLTRPVAQLNWGTTPMTGSSSNYESVFGEDGKYMQATLQTGTENVYSSVNLLTGEYTASTTAITFPAMAAPSGDGIAYPTVGTTTYEYVAMQYILAPATSSLVSLTLTISNAAPGNTATTYTNDILVTNAPLQANYKTNIYGNLLTGNVSLTVSKDEWGTPDNDVDATVWDGKTVTYPTVTTDKNTPVVINHASDLAGLAQMVSGTVDDDTPANDFEGYTITLAADFDMSGGTFPGIGSATRAGSAVDDNTKSFKGVFDGAGHTISNVTIAGTDNGDDAVGIFPNVSGSDAEIKNLVVDNLNINAPNNEQASVVGLLTDGATISNVTVTSGNISSAEGAAGIVGRVMGTGTVSGCENHANVSVSSKTCGGIAGAAYYTDSPGITIENCKNYGNVGNGTGSSMGGIVGVSGANIIGCTNEGNINGAGDLGGIVGYQNSCGSITDCTNNGNITSTGTNIGGILGWAGNIGYNLHQPIDITGNINNGVLDAPQGTVGGIISINRCTVNLSGNTNNAPSITGGSNAAGIVGNGFAGGTATQTGGNGYINYGEGNVNTTEANNITGTKTSLDYLGTVWLTSTDEASTH